jgi:sugar/nucleoside kinase (ribokinase family)
MKEIVQTLKKNNISIALNPSRYYIERAHKELAYMIANARVVITNREEAAAITGENFSDEKRVFKKFDAMVDGIAIMTDGARGAIASDGQTAYRCGTFKEKEMVDRTGAGDAFGAGFVSGFIRSNDICYGLRLGAANATSVVEYIGGTEGILDKKDFEQKRWKFLNLDVEPFY